MHFGFVVQNRFYWTLTTIWGGAYLSPMPVSDRRSAAAAFEDCPRDKTADNCSCNEAVDELVDRANEDEDAEAPRRKGATAEPEDEEDEEDERGGEVMDADSDGEADEGGGTFE